MQDCDATDNENSVNGYNSNMILTFLDIDLYHYLMIRPFREARRRNMYALWLYLYLPNPL